MAASRERRSNAGNRIAKLLDEEEEDDFYKTSYGGFSETADDRDYIQKNEEEDIVDSDFSIDENDEPVSDQEEEAPKRRKKVVTRAYKEPTAKKKSPVKTTKEVKHKPERQKSPKKKKSTFTVLDSGRKSFRKSTAAKTAATQSRIKQRVEAEKRKPKVVKVEEYIPTQEELLEEAEITEKENLKSLEKFRKMELEKKKTRPTKRVFTGPIVKYQSFTMPLVEEIPSNKSGSSESLSRIDSDDVDEAKEKSKQRKPKKTPPKVEVKGRCERTFITFDNDIGDKLFEHYFPKAIKKGRRSQICAITRLPARYFDPVTQLPYRNKQAFKILREGYYQQLEDRGNPDNPDVNKWLEWRKKIREFRYKSLNKGSSLMGMISSSGSA
ncbi:vacuolar protein sorting-associated protein 72 homolog [Armigeres subalbatus]|uniref:vacuolar protein sorting-associated protein 72 homolog n=1 Tax=Armigeres subalbatus TaxID=124917 RepID=UPI002ECFB08B